jgi:hypothetical protein
MSNTAEGLRLDPPAPKTRLQTSEYSGKQFWRWEIQVFCYPHCTFRPIDFAKPSFLHESWLDFQELEIDRVETQYQTPLLNLQAPVRAQGLFRTLFSNKLKLIGDVFNAEAPVGNCVPFFAFFPTCSICWCYR